MGIMPLKMMKNVMRGLKMGRDVIRIVVGVSKILLYKMVDAFEKLRKTLIVRHFRKR